MKMGYMNFLVSEFPESVDGKKFFLYCYENKKIGVVFLRTV